MYTVNLEKARKALPAAAVKDFDDIVEQRVLGASKHIQMIGKMIEQIAVDSVETNRTIAEMLERIQEVCQFFYSYQRRGIAGDNECCLSDDCRIQTA